MNRFFAEATVEKKSPGIAHTTHMQTFQQLRLKALANNQFRAATANIEDQTAIIVIRVGVRYTQVDQAGFLSSGNDIDRMSQFLLGKPDKCVTVPGLAQGIGAHNPDVFRCHAINVFGKLAQAGKPPFHGIIGQQPLFVDAGSKLHLFSQPFDRTDFIVILAGHNHMKTVGTEIYGSHKLLSFNTGDMVCCHGLSVTSNQ